MLGTFQKLSGYLLTLVSGILLVVSSYFAKSVPNKPDTLHKVEIKSISPTPVSTPSSNTTPATTYRVTTPTPLPVYVLTIISRPTFSSTSGRGMVSFSLNLKNLAVKPFITGLTLYRCSFTDERGDSISGHIDGGSGDGGVKFEKAVLPGTERVVPFNQMQVTTYPLEGTSNLAFDGTDLKQCGYDSNGNHTCTNIGGFKMVGCTAYVRNDGGTVGGDAGIKLDFSF